MRIIIDAMGGDNAPLEIIRGAAEASFITEATLVLVGKEDVIREHLQKLEYNKDRIEIHHADGVIGMDDDPMAVVRGKKDSSMSEGLRLLKDSGDAFVSAGNTGALHTGATLIVRNTKGVRRAAIATVLPLAKPILLMDSGANVSTVAENLVQWAYTGSIYMKNVMNLENPTVGLLNNGTEECKGTELQREAYELLSALDDINFIGNVESKDIPNGVCDVLITDGFTGNIALKLAEGMAKFMFGTLKEVFGSKLRGMLCYLLMKKDLRTLKNRFDSSAYGGAPILGISRPVIKAHGSSDAKAFKNAILQAEKFAASEATREIEKALAARREAASEKE